MQDHPKGGEGDPDFVTNDVEDDRLQAAALHLVLELHPATLTRDELIREMTAGGSRGFGEMDAIQRAVRDLAGSTASFLSRPSIWISPPRGGRTGGPCSWAGPSRPRRGDEASRWRRGSGTTCSWLDAVPATRRKNLENLLAAPDRDRHDRERGPPATSGHADEAGRRPGSGSGAAAAGIEWTPPAPRPAAASGSSRRSRGDADDAG